MDTPQSPQPEGAPSQPYGGEPSVVTGAVPQVPLSSEQAAAQVPPSTLQTQTVAAAPMPAPMPDASAQAAPAPVFQHGVLVSPYAPSSFAAATAGTAPVAAASKSVAGIVVLVVLILLVSGGGYGAYSYYGPEIFTQPLETIRNKSADGVPVAAAPVVAATTTPVADVAPAATTTPVAATSTAPTGAAADLDTLKANANMAATRLETLPEGSAEADKAQADLLDAIEAIKKADPHGLSAWVSVDAQGYDVKVEVNGQDLGVAKDDSSMVNLYNSDSPLHDVVSSSTPLSSLVLHEGPNKVKVTYKKKTTTSKLPLVVRVDAYDDEPITLVQIELSKLMAGTIEQSFIVTHDKDASVATSTVVIKQ